MLHRYFLDFETFIEQSFAAPIISKGMRCAVPNLAIKDAAIAKSTGRLNSYQPRVKGVALTVC
jgi:hypothetical protein